jgi:hypothetical protein
MEAGAPSLKWRGKGRIPAGKAGTLKKKLKKIILPSLAE